MKWFKKTEPVEPVIPEVFTTDSIKEESVEERWEKKRQSIAERMEIESERLKMFSQMEDRFRIREHVGKSIRSSEMAYVTPLGTVLDKYLFEGKETPISGDYLINRGVGNA